jgi:aryl-alcohol dehydrogenase-like predicted oxidoreductase
MEHAADLGVNFLDTAPAYGNSEVVFGHYLKDPAHRRKWIVCTKVGTCSNWGDGSSLSRQQVFEQCDRSLQRLQTDILDILLIHSIDQYGQGRQAVENVTQSGGIVDAMEELRKAGKIRFIGVSGQPRELLEAADSNRFDVLLTYNSYNLLVDSAARDIFPAAHARNLGVILGGAFYQGLLSGQLNRSLREKERFYEKADPAYQHTQELIARVRRLHEFVGYDDRELRRLALRFALSDSNRAVSTVIIGMRSEQELIENVRACAEGPLSESERAALDAIFGDLPTVSW